MTTPVAIDQMLQAFAARYRSAVLRRTAALALLGAAIAGVLGWRLRAAGAPPLVWIAAPTLLAAGIIAAAGRWARRRWIARQGAAAMLDRALGLQQRLVTAEEFAHAATPPALYPLLIEDAQRHVTTPQAGFPRPFDAMTGAMTAALLLLLLWPYLPQALPSALRQPPTAEPPPDIPPPDAPSQPPPPDQQDQASAPQPSPGEAGQQGQQEPQGGRDGSKRQDDAAQGGDTQPRDQSQRGEGQPRDGDQRGRGDQQDGAQQGSQGQQQRGQQAGQKAGQQAGQQGAQQAGQQEAGQKSGRQDGQRAGQRGEQGGGQGEGPGQPTPGQGDALKADIQELLKEVSGELKELQAQAAPDAEQPQAGTGTDPNLYGGDAPAEAPAVADPLAMELGSDAAPTAQQRSGAGIGRAGADVDRSGPKAKLEDAQLADQPVPEPPSSRQPIPAEYRSVFDQMRRTQQPAGEPTP